MQNFSDKTPPLISNPPEIYANMSQGQLYSPFYLEVAPMERLLLINFENDPDEVYIGFEPQVFDDSIHGTGIIVIAWRVDGFVDVYHQPSLKLNPDTYDIAGKGLADMIETTMEDAKFEITYSGVDAYFSFEDKLGRPIEVRIRENSKKERKPFGLLAPMGNAATSPSALPLVFLHDFYFVRQADTDVEIMVAGKSRKPDTLPLPIDFTRMYFMRYSSDPMITTMNPAYGGILKPLQIISESEARYEDVVYDIKKNNGNIEIEQMRISYKEHEVAVTFSPAVPNIANLRDEVKINGFFDIKGDSSVGTVSGNYSIERNGENVIIELIPSGGWKPNERKLPVLFMYTVVSDFKNWPKTYCWKATINFSENKQATMYSNWTRTR